jgi:RNA polymerase sigma-70 factor (ECF subfamily)
MDDEALLERARRGSRDAFGELVVRHQDGLYTMALRLLGRPEDAADVVQETFLRAYDNLPKLRGASVRGWLYRVASNCSRDVQRRGVRRPTSSLEDDDGKVVDLPDPALGPDATAEARERAAVIRDAVLALPVDYRAAVVMRDVNDLSYEEISDALRVPMGTVKSRINRGRAMLASRLRGSAVLASAVEGGA